MIEAAKIRNDQEVLKRLLSIDGDFVAAEARYHRKKGCLTAYISSKNITSVSNVPKEDKLYQTAVSVKHEFESSICTRKIVYEFSTLKDKFIEIALEKGCDQMKLKHKKIKSMLQSAWPEIQFISRPGQTYLVCSSEVTVEDAIKAASKMGNLLAEMKEDNEIRDDLTGNNYDDTEETILHQAAGIIRSRSNSTIKLEQEYFSPEESNFAGQKEFIDPLILKFIGWLSNKKLYDDGTDVSDEKVTPKLLAISCDLINLVTSCSTPKHFGLTVHLHHVYGSKKLIEDLHTLGYTLSYTEIRHFLTSAANHMSSSQQKTPSGALVPNNVKRVEDGGKLTVVEGDNWDHIEHTLDGKRSTHAMTTILVTPKSNILPGSTRIARLQERTIDLSEIPGT